ncbi:TIGR04206 family protein [Haloarcula marina]|uniref:TIGR04206 family protein n=1 Tax=Haloarcula marina TaxID=2961574 RepID=UPI0020B73A97|nr:TIGR04206 family protein [Halomicroarcula marina]
MVAGPRRRLLAVVVAGIVPWTVVDAGGGVTFVFAFGLFNTDPIRLVTVSDFFFRFTTTLPPFIESWGTGVALYLLGLVSAVGGVLGREDPRLTAFAIVAAGLSQFGLLLGFNRRIGYLALPVGSLLLVVVGWWYYWPLFDAPEPASLVDR